MKPRQNSRIFHLLVICLATLILGSCQKREESLSLLVWEGYADPSFIRAFEQAHHCKVTASYMGSSDDLVAKLRGGSASTYDVISPSSDVAASIARTGLAEPLDLTRLPTYPQLSSRLRDLPLVKSNGQLFGVPFMWGPNPLLYDTTVFAQAPDSWGILWDCLNRQPGRAPMSLCLPGFISWPKRPRYLTPAKSWFCRTRRPVAPLKKVVLQKS